MKITVNTFSQFFDEFLKCDRATQFSREGLRLLFDYFQEIEEQCPDVDVELDVIAICCEYCEMTPEQVCASYRTELDDNLELFLGENTAYIGKTDAGDFVFAQF